MKPQNRPWHCPIPARVSRFSAPLLCTSRAVAAIVASVTFSHRHTIVSGPASWLKSAGAWYTRRRARWNCS